MISPLHKLSLRTLKLFFRFMRRTHELFAGTGVAVVSAALVIGLFMLVWWGIGALKNVIELRLERALVERLREIVAPRGSLPSSEPPASVGILEIPALQQFVEVSDTAGLVSASFSDLFSGVGWLDTGATTMHHDRIATAFLFEPKFELRAATETDWTSASSLPHSVELVGRVVKVGDVYKGLVSRADGTPIFTEANTPFVSKYSGTFSFGGTSEDWLAVYGAYEGQAVRVRGGNVQNVSHLFGARAMDGGFRPGVLRDAAHRSWYVWDTEGERVRFLKLFEDNERNIVGITDLGERFVERAGDEVRKMEIRVGAGDGRDRILIRFAFAGNGIAYYEFFDNGFEGDEYAVVSGDLNNGRVAAVRRARIARADIAASGARVAFSLANTQGEWMPATVGEWVVFPDENGRNLFWKVEFGNLSGRQNGSPFFDFIQIEYFLKF
ncbi:MAG: hypothetical protein V1885_03265 [Candidatus Brennerbacteria bacterium]